MDVRNLYLSHIHLVVLSNKNGKINHIRLGAPHNFLAAIIQGHAVFNVDGHRVELYPGELLYIPRGCAYVSEWYGDPACTFYSLPFSFRYFSENGAFSLQKVCDGTVDFAGIMARMLEHVESDPALALSDFFGLYSYVSAHFEADPHRAEDSRVAKALRHMEAHPESDFDVPALARLCGMSESGFYSQFKAATGHTPVEYKNILRCRAAVELLCNTDSTVEDIADRLGCSTPSYLRRMLFKVVGKTPKQIRKEKQLI